MATSTTLATAHADPRMEGSEHASLRSRYLDAEIATWVRAQRSEPARRASVTSEPASRRAHGHAAARRRSRVLASTAASLAWSRLEPSEAPPWTSRPVPPSGTGTSPARRAFRPERMCR
jgi:hypothetical protein